MQLVKLESSTVIAEVVSLISHVMSAVKGWGGVGKKQSRDEGRGSGVGARVDQEKAATSTHKPSHVLTPNGRSIHPPAAAVCYTGGAGLPSGANGVKGH